MADFRKSLHKTQKLNHDRERGAHDGSVATGR
jgi:hypothetical protein